MMEYSSLVSFGFFNVVLLNQVFDCCFQGTYCLVTLDSVSKSPSLLSGHLSAARTHNEQGAKPNQTRDPWGQDFMAFFVNRPLSNSLSPPSPLTQFEIYLSLPSLQMQTECCFRNNGSISLIWKGIDRPYFAHRYTIFPCHLDCETYTF